MYKTYLYSKLDDAKPFEEQLIRLQECTQVLRKFRQTHQIVTEHHSDFKLILNEEGRLEKIEKIESTLAHTIVEESMVATNRAAGEFLAQHETGLHVSHPGYRPERREDIEKLLKEKLGDETVGKIEELKSFIDLIRALTKFDEHKNLLAIQQRFLKGSELSTNPLPHFGMGLEHYANITSPIRRYQDLLNQRLIHAILAKKLNSKKPVINNRKLQNLNEAITNNRNASRFMDQWLIAEYMKDNIGQEFQAYIALLTNQGIGIRLCENNIEGFIAAKKQDKDKPEQAFDKVSFNNQRLELSWNGVDLFYDEIVDVRLIGIDTDKNKLAFEFSENPISKE